MGDDPIAGIGALRTLPDTPLALLLKDQLGAFARHGPNMNAAEAAAALKLLSGFAMTYLEGFNAAVEDEESSVEEMHLTSSCRFLAARREASEHPADAHLRQISHSSALSTLVS